MEGGETLTEVGRVVGGDCLQELVSDGHRMTIVPIPVDLEVDLIFKVGLHYREEKHLRSVGGIFRKLLLQVFEDIFLINSSIHDINCYVEYDEIKCIHFQCVIVITFLLRVVVRVENGYPESMIFVC